MKFVTLIWCLNKLQFVTQQITLRDIISYACDILSLCFQDFIFRCIKMGTKMKNLDESCARDIDRYQIKPGHFWKINTLCETFEITTNLNERLIQSQSIKHMGYEIMCHSVEISIRNNFDEFLNYLKTCRRACIEICNAMASRMKVTNG